MDCIGIIDNDDSPFLWSSQLSDIISNSNRNELSIPDESVLATIKCVYILIEIKTIEF